MALVNKMKSCICSILHVVLSPRKVRERWEKDYNSCITLNNPLQGIFPVIHGANGITEVNYVNWCVDQRGYIKISKFDHRLVENSVSA